VADACNQDRPFTPDIGRRQPGWHSGACHDKGRSQKPKRGAENKAPNRLQTNTVTLVNVFTVEPDNQQKLVDLLKQGTGEFFSKAPGFISSRVLSGKDGTRVINYSQWKSAKEVAAFRQDPYFAPYIQRLKAVSTAESIECEVVYDEHV
jgi:heme-degrading monooxygenase HmoA